MYRRYKERADRAICSRRVSLNVRRRFIHDGCLPFIKSRVLVRVFAVRRRDRRHSPTRASVSIEMFCCVDVPSTNTNQSYVYFNVFILLFLINFHLRRNDILL